MPEPESKFKNENELIEACKLGDERGFRQIYDAYKKQVFSLTYYMCKQVETAEDLTQQIFLKVYLSLDSFKGRSRFSTWLFRIAMNVCIDELRKKERTKVISIGKTSPKNLVYADSIEAALDKAEVAEAIQESISKLSDTLRPTFVLRYISELSYSEISTILDCSIGTVGSRLNSCLNILANELKQFKEEI